MTIAGTDTNAANSRLRTNGSHHASDVAVSKRDLTSWWRQFKRGNAKREGEKGDLRLTLPLRWLHLLSSV